MAAVRNNIMSHPQAVKPDGGVKLNPVTPKLAVTPAAWALAQNSAYAAFVGKSAAMLIPPVFVAGLSVPLPSQFPPLILNHPLELARSIAMHQTVPIPVEPPVEIL